MKISFDLVKEFIQSTPYLTQKEKDQASEVIGMLEKVDEIDAQDWVRNFAPYKTKAEFFWHQIEHQSTLVDLEISQAIAEKMHTVRKRLSDMGWSLTRTDQPIWLELNGDKEILALKIKKAELDRLAGIFRSMVFNLSKDLVVQDSVNARRESEQ